MKTLYDLCLQAVSLRINDGFLGDEPLKLWPRISNDLHRIVSKNNGYNQPKVCDEASKWLAPTSHSITRTDMQECEREMIKQVENLVELRTIGISRLELFQSTRTTRNGTISVRMDFVNILKKILSSQSQKTLKSFQFSEEGVSSNPRWPSRMSKLLPSLEILSIEKETINEATFKELCESFKHLKVLNLKRITIRNIKSISRFEHLQHLSLNDIIFETKEDLAEVFELKQLKSLDLHPCYVDNRNIRTTELYLECGKVLPNLTTLDCSSNALSVENLKRLLNTHPTLEQIDIVDTTAKNVKNPAVKLLSTDSLSSCVQCLENYSSDRKKLQISKVLEEVNVILQDDKQKYSDQDLRNCLHEVVKCMMRWKIEDELDEILVQCLLTICRLQDFEAIFSFAEKQSLIRALFTARHSVTNRENLIAQILKVNAILNTSVDNIDAICDWAVYLIEHDNDQGIISKNCLEVLTKAVEKMTPRRRRVAARKFEKVVLDLVALENPRGDADDYFRVMDLLLSPKDELNPEVLRFLLNFGAIKLRSRANEFLEAMNRSVEALDEDTKKKIFGEENFAMISRLLNQKRKPDVQKVTVVFLVAIYAASGVQIDPNSKRLLNEEVQQFVINFDGDLSGVNVFKAIAGARKSEESVKFANWILSHFPEKRPSKRRWFSLEEEPAAKRRRFCNCSIS